MAIENKVLKTVGQTGPINLAVGTVGDVFNVVSAYGAFKRSTEEGDHIAVSAAKSITDFAVGEMFYGAIARRGGFSGQIGGTIAMLGITTGANLVAQHMSNTGDVIGKGTDNLTKGLGSGHFNMTEAGYTMRQRSLNAIRSNGANINSAFGNEARNYWLGL